MTKKKITDIFQEKVIIRKERNQYGEWETLEKTYRERRPVDGLSLRLRLVHCFVDLLVVILIVRIAQFLVVFNQPGIMDFLILIAYPGYYILTEFYFQQTIGKYLTSSLVVNEYGEKPQFIEICLRTFARMIPLEPYSFFWTSDGRFWHDTLTKTYVVSKDELSLIRRIQSGEKPKKSDEGQWDEWHDWQ